VYVQFAAARCRLNLRAGANFSRRQIGQRGQIFVARGGVCVYSVFGQSKEVSVVGTQ